MDDIFIRRQDDTSLQILDLAYDDGLLCRFSARHNTPLPTMTRRGHGGFANCLSIKQCDHHVRGCRHEAMENGDLCVGCHNNRCSDLHN